MISAWIMGLMGVASSLFPGAGAKASVEGVSPRVKAEDVPAWVRVEPVELGASLPPEVGRPPYVVLLDDQQVHLGTRQRFVRQVGLVRSAEGAERGARLRILLRPEREELCVHGILIRRGGEVQDRFAPGMFKWEADEEGKGEGWMVGQVEDVRLGDVVDVRYSLRSRSDAVADKFTGSFSLQAWEPAVRLRLRLVEAEGVPVVWRSLDGAGDPKVDEFRGSRTLTWEHGPAKVVGKGEQPPRVEVSEYGDWKGLAAWAAGRLTVSDSNGGVVGEMARSVAQKYPLRDDRITELIRMVQREIRSVERDWWREVAPPSVVLARSEGSSAEKALLLQALLREAGVVGELVLGHGVLMDWGELPLPSPHLFDRVFVRVHDDGRTLVFDPFRSVQGGCFRQMYFPGEATGLRLTGETYGSLGAENGGAPLVRVGETFYLSGFEGDGELAVELVHEHEAADRLRALFVRLGREAFAEDYVRRLATIYPQARVDGEVHWEDDEDNNRIVMRARFRLPKPWRWDARSRTWSFPFVARDTATWSGRVDGSPFAFPASVEHRVAIHGLGSGVRAPHAEEWVREDFRLRSGGRYEEGVLLLSYDFELLGGAEGPVRGWTPREVAQFYTRLQFMARLSTPGSSAKKAAVPRSSPAPETPVKRRY